MVRIIPRQTVKASVMRSINRIAILDMIREESPISRTRIARRLNLSLPTVMRSIDDLVKEDLVRPSGQKEASGGRPSPLLEFNGSAYAVVGVDLGGTKMFGMIADLSGRIQHEIYQPRISEDPDFNLTELAGLIEQLLRAPRPAGQVIRGIGIGAPGVTDRHAGVVTWAPSLGWRNLPLKQILSDRFKIPVLVENDVNLAALGELGFGAGRRMQNLVCVSVGTGIGAGIIIGGALYRGHNQTAGEIGYLLPGAQFLGRSYAKYGALESIASGTGVAEQAMRYFQAQGKTPPAAGWQAEDVFNAARDGEDWAKQIVATTIDHLSLAIASVNVLLDPQVIILGGGVSKSADLLIEPILERLKGTMPTPPNLVASSLSYRATVMGAIMLVLNGTMEYLVVERYV